jgi:VIT1/CCC1 family predicted Fe2+/Mn2+ transporter
VPLNGMTELKASVESHLGSHDVSRVLYGTIVGLALVLALEADAHRAGETAVFILATALTIGLAELFAEAISQEARTREPISRAQLGPLVRDALAVVIGAGFPAIFFILSALGLMKGHTAFTLAKWSGLALVCAYAFLAARMTGAHVRHATRHAVTAGLIGVALIVVKSLLH